MGKPLDGRLFRIVAGAALIYALCAYLTDPSLLILVLNGLLLSTSAGVMVAYAPVVVMALAAPLPTKGDYLGAGIFLVGLGVWLNRVISFVARDLGYPDVYNTHLMSFVLATGLLGGLFHLWAPNAAEGRLPLERWGMTGGVVALSLFVVFGAWTTHAHMSQHPSVLLR